MRLKELALSIVLDLTVFFLVSNFLPSTTPYATVIAIVTPTIFWFIMYTVARKRKQED